MVQEPDLYTNQMMIMRLVRSHEPIKPPLQDQMHGICVVGAVGAVGKCAIYLVYRDALVSAHAVYGHLSWEVFVFVSVTGPGCALLCHADPDDSSDSGPRFPNLILEGGGIDKPRCGVGLRAVVEGYFWEAVISSC